MAPHHALAESPDLHSPKPILRVSNSPSELNNRVELLLALQRSSGAMTLCYTDALLSTNAPKHWPIGLRRLLLALQGGICPDCHEAVSVGDCHVDHIRPRVTGGTSILINLLLRHSSCNIAKGAHETGWSPTPRVFHGYGVPANFQQNLLLQLFDPTLTASRLDEICEVSVRTVRRAV